MLALGRALLECDAAEARIRTQLILDAAINAGFEDVRVLAGAISARLLASGPDALTGIGQAYADLLDAVDRPG